MCASLHRLPKCRHAGFKEVERKGLKRKFSNLVDITNICKALHTTIKTQISSKGTNIVHTKLAEQETFCSTFQLHRHLREWLIFKPQGYEKQTFKNYTHIATSPAIANKG